MFLREPGRAVALFKSPLVSCLSVGIIFSTERRDSEKKKKSSTGIAKKPEKKSEQLKKKGGKMRE